MEAQLTIQNFPKQQAIFEHPAKFKIAVKGRRFGLTKGAANNFIEEALNGKFTKGLWVDVVNSNIDKYIERYFLPHLKKLPENMWEWRKQAKMVTINGAYIDFRSAEKPETLEGFGYDKAFLNEAGIILNDEYLWNNAIRPMFWDYPNVKVVIGGTPKGGGGVFETLAARGDDPDQPQYQTFRFTSFDSPFSHVHEAIKSDMVDMPERVIKQEIMAQFLEDSGVVFRGVNEAATATPQPPQPGHYYTMGVDLAKVQDWTVIAVYDRGNNKQVYQARFNKLEWPTQRARIAETSKHFNNASIVLDTTGVGEPIYDDLSRAGVPVIPYKFTNESKKQLIDKLATWIELKRIRLLPIEETIRELTRFTYDISPLGRVMYEAPAGFHDDIVIAHGLAVWDLVPLYKEPTSKPPSLIAQEFERRKERFYDEDGEYTGLY